MDPNGTFKPLAHNFSNLGDGALRWAATYTVTLDSIDTHAASNIVYGGEIQNRATHNTTFPTPMFNGDTHYDESNQVYYYYDNTRNLWLSSDTISFSAAYNGSIAATQYLSIQSIPMDDSAGAGTFGFTLPWDGTVVGWTMSWLVPIGDTKADLHITDQDGVDKFSVALSDTGTFQYNTTMTANFGADETILVKVSIGGNPVESPQITLFVKRSNSV
jgi:hypothetical protein